MNFSGDQLIQFCTNLLQGVGVPKADAEIVADVLVDTSLEGLDTHGISRLPIYVTRIQNGRINPQPNIKVNKTAPSVATVDGDNGLGQLVGVKSMEVAINLAKETGVGAVATKHSNHYGASSYFCKQAAAAGMVGLAFTNTPSGIPPWGGRESYFGTNPIAFGFPGKEQPVVVDMSSSIVARGNIILAAKQGKPIPEGWAIDKEGKPTTDAKAALDGAVLPMAGPKGYAMALAVEIMSGILSGSAFGKNVGWIYDESTQPVDIGHFFIALDVSKFMPMGAFIDRMQQMITEIKETPKAEGVEEIYIPGERRTNKAALRNKEGVPVSDQLLAELNQLAQGVGATILG
ncbi:Ldh family oxidoreductase [Desulforamulus ruminis]|uniref:Malate dehydrogenase n=1 Tax=Desulforamulus ruminis (strain ATCC 23193 / DSM 2154 / NCIMB 8452 / DL) TaxID=696281 RepID=F6DSW3_DESRL|nr:Ldh family oxidoreductase [Desulforamulus ruminis]AEG59957.1 Malate dehydrogenase [Desulforamulus ruminis DSM 2154]